MIKTPVKKSIKSIDFNCDLAQSFGVYKNSAEFDMLDYVNNRLRLAYQRLNNFNVRRKYYE